MVQERNAKVEAHLHLIYPIAVYLSRTLPPCFPLDDLQQQGAIGLILATEDFDATRGPTFEKYARWRIYTCIVDWVRANWRASVFEPLHAAMAARQISVEELLILEESLRTLPKRVSRVRARRLKAA